MNQNYILNGNDILKNGVPNSKSMEIKKVYFHLRKKNSCKFFKEKFDEDVWLNNMFKILS